MKMMTTKYAPLVLLLLISSNEALRILVWFPLFSKSHNSLGRSMCNHLLDAGHEVVYITSHPSKILRANLTEVDVSAIEKKYMQQMGVSVDKFKLQNMVGKENIGDSLFFFYMAYEIHRLALDDETAKNFLSDPKQKFDAVILEWVFSDLIAGIAPLFEAPLIWLGSTEAHWQVLRLMDDIPNPAFNVDLFSPSRPPLSFWERVEELWKLAKKYVVMNALVIPFEKRLYYKVFPEIAANREVKLPSYEEAVYNGSFLFLFSHPSLGTPFSLPQNAKYIGGYHIDTKVKALPKDLQKLMDEAKHGVVYFSMGSYLKSADMTSHMKQSLLKMFSRLKQIVIWKFEEDLENVPANIHLMKWAPQQSIFAHPNLKMFITHGGQLSTTEAIHFGVPVVGIPVFGDQYVNMQSAVQKGFGIKVKLAEDMAEDIYNAVQEILSNPTYSTKAKELSAIYHDRPMTSGEEIVYWVEHVVRTKGAKHLRATGHLVPMYQKLYLDLIALIVVVLGVLYILVKFIAGLFKKKKSNPVSKSGKKTKVN